MQNSDTTVEKRAQTEATLRDRLVARFKAMAQEARALGFAPEADAELIREAADEIERLQRNIQELRDIIVDLGPEALPKR